MKDLIIGGASNYTWDHLKYWVNSIRQSGFKGDVVLVGTNMTRETIEKLTTEGVMLSLYGKQQENGDIIAHGNGAPHVERFYYLWNYLNSTENQYRYVITTDTRDVIFQSDPTQWIENNMKVHSMVASSEGMRYKNEPWGNQNLLDAFGPYFHDQLKDNMIYNVGTLAGDVNYIKGLLSFIFHLSVNRPIPIVDQAVFNFIVDTNPFKMDTRFTNNDDAWAIQLGTTAAAVAAGKGDLGRIFIDSPEKYDLIYEDKQPIIMNNGQVLTPDMKPYVIVHQYDRVPELKDKIESIYGD